LKKVTAIVDDLVQRLKKAFTDLGLEAEWATFEEKINKANEAKQAERNEKYKSWIMEYWLTNNMKKNEKSQKMIDD